MWRGSPAPDSRGQQGQGEADWPRVGPGGGQKEAFKAPSPLQVSSGVRVPTCPCACPLSSPSSELFCPFLGLSRFLSELATKSPEQVMT